MNLLVYLAGAVGFLFLFFFTMDRTDTEPLFRYLGYMSILVVFYFLTAAIVDIIEGAKKREAAYRASKGKKYTDYKATISNRWRR